MVLIYLLIAFFISLLTYQLILAFYPTIEGMDTNDNQNGDNLQYEDYPTDPIVCCKKNSGNIEYLKDRVDNLSTTTTNINKMQSDIDALQQQVNDMGTQISQLAGNMISQAPLDTSAISNTALDQAMGTTGTTGTTVA
jgi:hypothetical protein